MFPNCQSTWAEATICSKAILSATASILASSIRFFSSPISTAKPPKTANIWFLTECRIERYLPAPSQPMSKPSEALNPTNRIWKQKPRFQEDTRARSSMQPSPSPPVTPISKNQPLRTTRASPMPLPHARPMNSPSIYSLLTIYFLISSLESKNHTNPKIGINLSHSLALISSMKPLWEEGRFRRYPMTSNLFPNWILSISIYL